MHHLVANAFLPPKPNDGKTYEIDHISRNKADNRASNLRWVTKSENRANTNNRERGGVYINSGYGKSRYAISHITCNKKEKRKYFRIRDINSYNSVCDALSQAIVDRAIRCSIYY